jgi:hypothetical protein
MKKKDSVFEKAIYLIMCVLSLGSVYLLRVIITEAIRYAMEDEK